MKLWLQSFAGLLMAVVGFAGGAFLTTLIPAAGGKYMSPLGELIVAVVIFAATLGLALVARFARSVLFLTLGLTAMFVVTALTLLSGGHWWGDFEEVWDHTLLPVALSATAVAIIRTFRAGGVPNHPSPGKAGRAARLAPEHHRPGLPDTERSAQA